MTWAKRKFRGKDTVWVQVDGDGELVLDQGRVAMRYSDDENAKVYNAAAHNIGDAKDPAKNSENKAKNKAQTITPFDELVWKSPTSPANFWTDPPEDLADIAPPNDDRWEFFTDGACSGNPGPCGWGWLLRHGESYVEANQNIGIGTNNIAEMMAILTALEYAAENGGTDVAIHTDSNLSIGLLTKGWKAKKNKELVLATREKLKEFKTPPTFVKVKGHSGDPLNDRADYLATSSIKAE